MVIAVLTTILILPGAAVWSVLNRPVADDPARNELMSAVLLGATVLAGAALLIGAFAGWW